MERSLHQQLKRFYAEDDSCTEVVMGRYRIDAVRGDELVEIQCASLAAIRDKCQSLLKQHRLRIVKPVIARKRITKINKEGGKITSSRISPKRGTILDLFEELIYFTRVFPNPNLVLEVPIVCVEEIRMPRKQKRRRRWDKDYQVFDVQLESIDQTCEISQAHDLLEILAWRSRPDEFNTADIAAAVDRPRCVAQQIAYVLRKMGAIESIGRTKSGMIYEAQRAA